MTIQILLAENSQTVTKAIHLIFQHEPDFSLSSVRTLKEVQEQITEKKPDLLILDRQLSDGNSVEMVQKMRERQDLATLPVLFLSPAGQLGSHLPHSKHLPKPFGWEDLLTSCRALLLPSPLPAEAQQPETHQDLPAAKEIKLPEPAAKSKRSAATISTEEIREMARKKIEEVVWEVVPELAETIIREELARLLKKGS